MSIEKRPVRVARAAGFSVHLFTASGGAVAVLALYAAIERHFPVCFAWLGLALFIDGIDGTLARAAKVHETAATIDGVVLDLVVDFLTYVLVPVVALWRSDLMPTEVSFWIGLVVTIASALYFADTRMKTDDLWFRGFPGDVEHPGALSFRAAAALGGERGGAARRGGDDVRADRLRPPAARHAAARGDHRAHRRLVRLRRAGDRRQSCPPVVGRGRT